MEWGNHEFGVNLVLVKRGDLGVLTRQPTSQECAKRVIPLS